MKERVVTKGLFITCSFIVHRGFMVLAIIASGVATSLQSSPAQSQDSTVMTSDNIGADARQAMIDIFRKKDATAVDRYFGEARTDRSGGADTRLSADAFPV